MRERYWREIGPDHIRAYTKKVSVESYSQRNTFRLDVYKVGEKYESRITDESNWRSENSICSDEDSLFEAAAALGQTFKLMPWRETQHE